MRSKSAMQLPFAWIFASIAGAVILFIAVYVSVKLINQGETEIDIKAGREVGILLNPLETGLESGQTTFITLPAETRIYNECTDKGAFGEQVVMISQMSFKKWTDTGTKSSFQNRYIFSKNYTEGKKFYIFSKPLEIPFKVADLVYITSSREEYCFIDAPENIEEEIESLGQENLKTENCSAKSIKVCFSSGYSCNISVEYPTSFNPVGTVAKKSDRLYFETDALMYGAIFSEKAVYECQLKRLMKRTEQLSSIYRDKAILVSQKECNSNLDLALLAGVAAGLHDSKDIGIVGETAKRIGEENEFAECRLW
jgi:hypothetical protein